MKIAIIDYGVGNIQSVCFALERLGHQACLTADFSELKSADKIIFPGVGHAGFAMQQLQKNNLIQAILQLEQPVLGICLGMQLLCAFTEEDGTKGLGIFDVSVHHFQESVKVPQMGWNQIQHQNHRLFKGVAQGAYVYLVHGYYVPDNAHAIATTDYGLTYATAIAKDNFYGVQFHPEKSGAVGRQILQNFLDL